MAVRPARNFREPKAIELLAFAYALGAAGTLWDWREHLLGPGTQPPHFVIDLGGLLVISALAFSGRIDLRSRTFIALYVLLVLVVLVAFGPFVLMMAAPRSALMASLMHSMMSSGALLVYLPLVLLASWSAWRRNRVGPVLAPDASHGAADVDGGAAAASGDTCRFPDRTDWCRLGSCPRHQSGWFPISDDRGHDREGGIEVEVALVHEMAPLSHFRLADKSLTVDD